MSDQARAKDEKKSEPLSASAREPEGDIVDTLPIMIKQRQDADANANVKGALSATTPV